MYGKTIKTPKCIYFVSSTEISMAQRAWYQTTLYSYYTCVAHNELYAFIALIKVGCFQQSIRRTYAVTCETLPLLSL